MRNVKAFVICLGANDSSDAKSETKQHVPLDEYRQNLGEMIQHLIVIISLQVFSIFKHLIGSDVQVIRN